MQSFTSKNTEKTQEVGQKFAANFLTGDEIICLNGELGSGKTNFTKGIAKELKYQNSEHPVSSPTFTLVNEYFGKKFPIYHFDFYRLNSPQEIINLGWDEYINEQGIIIVEWANKFPTIIDPTFKQKKIWQIDLKIIGKNSRKIIIAQA